MDLFILGYRGSGKSVVGQGLAEATGAPLFDTDQQICAHFGGMTVAEIWAAHGEPAFRAVEVDILKSHLQQANAASGVGRVISLGGGTPVQPEATALLTAKAQRPNVCCIYLKAPAEVLASRIEGDANSAALRPGLTGAKVDPAAEVAAVLAAREATYEAVADLIVDVSSDTPAQVVAAILAQVKQSDDEAEA